ncbi:hypothetical protein Pst134EA_002606 [Puccinia striiformis f. sp. tritici]|uniref:hypothetical protein n=1 Tax=Puccinia striiformis f. sp. tritici TaxID=168172 RepID=UPI0020078515|nr:hypothetical protein Pst134EA_002606 [Puccinia striiformis f. sp. tritici]KAH9471978.1 hypothetical protein Pst134EA_002606 [Puccinia striiformis f. sp. tritici]
MDSELEQLSLTIIKTANRLFSEGTKRYLVGICGRPGSGKTTIAKRLSGLINSKYCDSNQDGKDIIGSGSEAVEDNLKSSEHSDISIVIGLDGWHYPRSVLDTFEDPIEARLRRGSPETFDSTKYLNFLQVITDPTRRTSEGEIEYAPGFSHTLKDPIERQIAILPTHKIIILEGLYTSLQSNPVWKQASLMVHTPIRIDVHPDIARLRLVNRHLISGICDHRSQAEQRVDSNDGPNGDFLLKNSRLPEYIITSIDDPSIKISDQTP